MSSHPLSFCTELERIYVTGEALDSSGRRVTATGLSTVNNLLTIRNLILSNRPNDTLEVGLAYGGSGITFLSSLHDCDFKGNRFRHTAIDPGQASFGHAGIESISRAGFLPNFRFIEESSALALPALVKDEESFGMIYIDGYHLFEHAFTDLFYSLMLLEPGGIVLLDDCTDPHVAKVVRFARTHFRNQLSPVDLSPFRPAKSPLKRLANKVGFDQLKAFRRIGELPRVWDERFQRF